MEPYNMDKVWLMATTPNNIFLLDVNFDKSTIR